MYLISLTLTKLNILQYRYRVLYTFIIVFILVFVIDFLFNQQIESIARFLSIFEYTNILDYKSTVDFAPEVWAAIIALVLGTLIIVIAIAAENTPRLVDIFVKDWISLLFIWFIIIASVHCIYIFNNNDNNFHKYSALLNTNLFLPISSLLSLPYILYILLLSKNDSVIKVISKNTCKSICEINSPFFKYSMKNPIIIEYYHKKIITNIDQLDDLLNLTESEEIKNLLLIEISKIIQVYISEKNDFNESFFIPSDSVKLNTTFRSYDFKDYDYKTPFIEYKVLKNLTRSYYKLIFNDCHNLATVIPAEFVNISKVLIKNKDKQLIDFLNTFNNTLFRYAIKHAYKNNEPRNLYNLSFHYSNMIKLYINAEMVDVVKYYFDKVKFYANDLYKNSIKNPSLYFIVDALSYELKNSLILIHKNNWNNDNQLYLLNLFFRLDNPPGYSKDEVDKGILGANNGTRRIQIGLALYYLSKNNIEYAKKVIVNFLDDLKFFDEKIFRQNLETQCFLLSIFKETFWEDTDRGNLNIYFSKNKSQIDKFKKLTQDLLEEKLHPSTSQTK